MELSKIRDIEPPLAAGRYRLLDLLGEGGMAKVFLTFDTTLHTARAIKVLDPSVANKPSLRARFTNEARTMARLSHPSVLTIHDVGVDGTRAYMVMELLRGGTLWDWVQAHGCMPARVAMETLIPVLEALSQAHQMGVVHRDLKPQNILLTRKGVAKVSDFGIARVESGTSGALTRTGSVMGTLGYMAPEQRNSAKQVDGRSDIYGMGATLFALLTGDTPMDLFAAEQDPQLLDALDPLMQTLVGRCTRYRPEDRPADISSLLELWSETLEQLPPAGDHPPLGQRLGPSSPLLDQSDTEIWERLEEQPRPAPGAGQITESRPQAHLEAAGAQGESESGISSETFWQEDEDPGSEPSDPEVQESGERGGETPGPEMKRSKLPLFLFAALSMGIWAGQRWLSESDPVQQQAPATPQAPGQRVPVLEQASPEGEEEGEDGSTSSPQTPADPSSGEEDAALAEASSEEERSTTAPQGQAEGGERDEGPEGRDEEGQREAAEEALPEQETQVPGHIAIEGNPAKVWVVDAMGRELAAGPVSPGDYVLHATFERKPDYVTKTSLTVSAGQQLIVECHDGFLNCKLKTP